MSNYININAEVHIDDVLWAMSSSEKQELVDDLYEDGYIPKQVSNYEEPKTEFDQACMKLFGNGWKLTKEQEEYIIGLAKQFN